MRTRHGDRGGRGGATPRGRALRLALVLALGLVAGGVGYLAIQVLGAPGPRAANGWSLLAEMPHARGETAGATADDRLYVLGGLTGLTAEASREVSVYDAAGGTWTSGPALPAARHHAAAAAVDGTIYVSGGAPSALDWTPTATLWALGPGASTWTEMRTMPEGRLGHRMVAVGNRLYVVGGVTVASPAGSPPAGTPPSGLAAGSVLIYDPSTGAWSAGAPMRLSRDHIAVVVVEGEIWAIGGRASGLNHARVDIYDPVADAWRDGRALPEATSGAAEAAVGGVILISGGEDPGRGLIVDRHWRLDAASGAAATWAAIEVPPYAVHGGVGAAINGRFIVVSGSLRPGGQSSTAWTGATQAFVP